MVLPLTSVLENIDIWYSTATIDFEDLDIVGDIALSTSSTKGKGQKQSNITPQKRVFYYEKKTKI